MIPLNANLMRMKRSGIRVFTNLAKEQGDCVMLTIGEPDFDTPQPIKAAAIAALENNETHYAPNQGTSALRRAIAEFETRRGFPCDEDQVLITVGACEALFTALLGILNPGDEVIVPTPAFPLYESIIALAGAKLVPLDLTRTDFQITGETLEQVMTEKTKAIILNSPNNPTGVVFSQDSLAAVKAAVLGRDIFLICDNVYQHLSCEPLPDLSLDEALRDQVLLCQSFSKPWAMTGWRVGYLAGPKAVIGQLLLLHAGAVTAVPTFLQSACIQALRESPAAMAATYDRRREYVCRRLDQMGISYPKPTGAFYIFPDISQFGIDSATLCTRLIREAKVATVPGSCFGSEGYLRISCCCSDKALEEGLNRMEQFFAAL